MIGPDPVVVARGKDGVVRVLLNRCTHRANRLCNADKGNANSFRCPYHGWTFNNTGALQGVPMREGYGEAFDEVRAELGLASAAPRGQLRRVRLRVAGARRHLAAASTSAGATHAIDRLLNLSPDRRIDLRANWMKHRHHANWKMVMENNVDGYHALFTHDSVYDAIKPGEGLPRADQGRRAGP